MKYRILGRTGLKVSEIGLGCWEAGGDFWKSKDEQALQAFGSAIKSGINFFDTAFDYGEGHSEQLVGNFVGKNSKIIVATKVPPKDMHWPAVDNNIQNAFPKKHILEFAMKSYKNFGGRTIDILQLHVWKDEWANETCWREAFDELRSQGIARFFGVSINDHAPASALRIVESGDIDSIQTIYNIFDQSPEDELFNACIKNKVGVIARVPFDEGSLTGRFTLDTKFDDWRKNYFTPERLKETVERIERLEWLESSNRTFAQAALQFCLHHKAVSTVIPGSTNPKHVEMNAHASDGELTTSEIQKLKKHRWIRNFYQKW